MHSVKKYGFWTRYNGRKVLVDRQTYRIVVRDRWVTYPYRQHVVDVTAEPVSRVTAYYRQMKRQLGDDWVTDVLGTPETEHKFLVALGHQF